MAFGYYRSHHSWNLGIVEVPKINKVDSTTAHTIISALLLVACGYIYTIDHGASTPVFVVIGALTGYWFGKFGQP